MIKEARDRFAKILSFPVDVSGIDIAVEENVLWPCHAFLISVPRVVRELNILEETILKLAELNLYTTETVAKSMGLDPRLTGFIQRRLKEYGLLKEHFMVSETGREKLRKLEEKPTEIVTARIYVDLIGGNLLPFVNYEEHNGRAIRSWKKHEVEFKTEDSGEYAHVTAKKLFYDKDRLKTRPTAAEFFTIAKKYFRAKEMLGESVEYDLTGSHAAAVNIPKEGELVYLHCKVLFLQDGPGFHVTDGIGFGFSPQFMHLLEKREVVWLNDSRNKGIDDGFFSTKKIKVSRLLGIFTVDAERYGGILGALESAEECFEKIENLDGKHHNTSKFGESEKKKQSKDLIRHLYEAVTETLSQVSRKFPIDYNMTFRPGKYEENNTLLRELAHKIGFQELDPGTGLLKPPAKKNDKMPKHLAYCLAGANRNPPHPFNHLAGEFPEALSVLESLKKQGDHINHGGSLEELTIRYDEIKEFREQIHRLILALFPEFRPAYGTGDDTAKAEVNRRWFNANAIVTERCPFLSTELKDLLTHAEIDLADIKNGEQTKTAGFLVELAAVMQHVLKRATTGHQYRKRNWQEYPSEAFSRLSNAGFAFSANSIPDEISTVQKQNIINAFRKKGSTLGADLIAWAIKTPEGKLLEISQDAPDLAMTICELIRLRGNSRSNQSHLSMLTLEQIEKIQQSTYSIIQVLMEK